MAISRKQQAGLKSFDADLKKFSKTVGISLEKVVRKVAFDIFRKTVLKTPVDKGRLRASWNINAGRPNLAVQPKGVSASRQGATQAALQQTTTFSMPTPYTKVYITNNLPYAQVIEQGRIGNRGSFQAPRGMLRVSIAEVEAGMVRIVREATR